MTLSATSTADDLKGKHALVTGATQGLGRAIAEIFARAGASVAVHGRTASDTEETVSAIRHAGGHACAVEADFLKTTEIAPMVELAAAQLGGIDILVNNAGIGAVAEVSAMDEVFWDRMIDIDLKAPFLVTQKALEYIGRDGGGGRVIFISSTAAKAAEATFAAYSAAKAGILAFARCLAVEVGSRGITVNSICPGWIDTPLSRDPIREWAEEKGVPFDRLWQEMMADTNLLKKVLEPDDIAECALFLSSERGRHITAQSVNVCGGLIHY
ncbi:SDR family NAD(P)-dependent oxidoreductase [Pseudaminobacter soli (ex Li et al. 2025)]|uniref:D-beta-hydroxybutyrate dehydrogenase n=1 Tax=Pseudaminobacter soli (ex Li et al. 2025) TaxID=1295366 RepID=A0A2P7RSM9_9HYPH|nr:SDR family NAD(P)-dependent oxidoreductase [Mesorhizobium soli]PSJ53202.1 D-beta-hydroxybutyrate dehydrogenase [Mesorhizobium soli]